ncbi:MAG: sulfite reductase subunit A, partial [Planctomycetales bacterium]|nr:sulfite reductase subunit A [Planctomycetales bacterium]NIM08878.1 sulfite reductase subunit A [Planctomycetales bacterium]NIN08338.1 sulfite reductase subunit A [Planctomycetales bacterium]NIN77466.1 sulfite reductase subunit A [Planctomycetales bacterium]NIO34638.1 sulfite reductase subunit A [Planctomycetales bacterium]
MSSHNLPVGTFVTIAKDQLAAIIQKLQQLGYRTIGPQIAESAIVYDDLDAIDQIPVGYLDEQDGGHYRLQRSGEAWFDYVVGPHSLKNYLFPPREPVLELQRIDNRWHQREPERSSTPLAVIGLRSCDLHALRIQDRVFLGEHYEVPAYKARRETLFLVAVNCRRAADTCFCHSMNTGPAVTSPFDLALTELDAHFVVQIGSQQGSQVIGAAEWSDCTPAEIDQAKGLPEQLRERMAGRGTAGQGESAGETRGRHLDTTGIHDLLLDNLEHPRWEEVAQRCLACANCTMVCPTCFCSSVEDVTDLTGEQVRRERSWSSCFTAEHSYLHSGTVRKTTASRYRQWLTHKLATWIDQFGTSGCVGCGRCITWCPVGI